MFQTAIVIFKNTVIVYVYQCIDKNSQVNFHGNHAPKGFGGAIASNQLVIAEVMLYVVS